MTLAHPQIIKNTPLQSSFEDNLLCNKLITNSIRSLALLRKNRVLELNHGLCEHLPFLMKQAADLKYFGMEVSEKTVKSVNKLHKKYVDEGNALFQQFDGFNVPYVHNIFDRILTVNTLYYWEDPVAYFNELFRSLKHGGVCVVSFADSLFLEQLPVLEDKNIYRFYDEDSLTKILLESNFKIFNIQELKERVKTKDGGWNDESYFVLTLRKKEKIRFYR